MSLLRSLIMFDGRFLLDDVDMSSSTDWIFTGSKIIWNQTQTCLCSIFNALCIHAV